MNHINKDYEINVPPSPSLTPSSLGMSTPERLTPDRLPDPWLLDTESLLSELGRVCALALNIPAARNDILGPINSVIDALWGPGRTPPLLLPSTLRGSTQFCEKAR
jgi:hypothetical protein